MLKGSAMKVTLGKETYLMHWETRKFSPAEGNNTDVELVATDCIIRRVLDNGGIDEIFPHGHVSQTSCDQENAVTARRLSFIKAIKYLDRPLRKALGHEYNRTCRVTSWSQSQKNRKLKARIADLQAEIAKMKEGQRLSEVERTKEFLAQRDKGLTRA